MNIAQRSTGRDPEYSQVDTGRLGRDEEFTTFVKRSSSDLLRTAWLLTGDSHRAEELVQQALVRAYLAWPKARARDPLAYTRRTIANLRVDTWRRRRREVLVPAEALINLPNRDTRPPELSDELIRALLALPEGRRKVVVLRHVLGLTEREVAADLNISVGAVKSASSRGIGQIREALQSRHGGEE